MTGPIFGEVLEAFQRIEDLSGEKMLYELTDTNREGDHICYISDLTKLQTHYPSWRINRSLPSIIDEMVEAERSMVIA